MASSNTLISFNVSRKTPELIPPAKPTPHEFKPLSDVDDQEGLRFHASFIQIYRENLSMEGNDPVTIIGDAIAKALVFYYPFAGRLREITSRKLVVECTAEGVLFIEADADVALHQLGPAIYPPFHDLLYPGSTGITNSPLMLVQVTRLKCRGFIFAYSVNHTMCDGIGLSQFISAIIEFARSAKPPSIPPVWERQLLYARNQPRVSCMHHEYGVVPTARGLGPPIPTVQHSFLFRDKDIYALRHLLPPNLRRCSKFHLLTACIWRCRSIALSQSPTEEVKLLCVVNARDQLRLPKGYYGNAMIFPAAVSSAENLSKYPLHYAVELILKTKSEATEEYVKSVADLMVIRGRPNFTVAGTYMVYDLTHVGFDGADFGWGNPVYGGPAKGHTDILLGASNFVLLTKNNKGENEIFFPICLPSKAMEVFENELKLMMGPLEKVMFLVRHSEF